MRFWLTVLAVIGLLGLAVRLGRGPERFAAICLAANFFVTLLDSVIRTGFAFKHFDPVLFSIDFATWIGLTWNALRANRMWPLYVSSLQLLVVFAHASAAIYNGWNQAYWGMMITAQYVALLVSAVGILAHYRREKRVGRYRSWRAGGLLPRPVVEPVGYA